MHIIRSFFMAFSMYSRIPVPQVAWKEENRRYALCFFPFIGAVIGGLLLGWQRLCAWAGIGNLLYAAGCVLLPVLVTGGIHMDGYLDVCDAKSSFGDRDKLFEIMKDSHIGAFAVIHLGLYLLMQLALFGEVDSWRLMAVVGCGFVQSRALSGLAAVTFRNARGEGTLQNFTKSAHRRTTIITEFVLLAASAAGMVLAGGFSGVAAFAAGVAVFAYYRRFSYRKFGGITGDLAGYFLQLCEIFILAGAVLTERVIN